MHLTQFKFLILSLLGFSFVMGIFHISNTFASIGDPDREYVSVYQMPALSLLPDETRQVSVMIKNTSVEIWDKDVIKLGTMYKDGTEDRISAWSTDDWESEIRVLPNNSEDIRPLQVAEFTFTITAPSHRGVYQEYFRPVLENDHWLKGEEIVLTFRVGEFGDVIVAEGPQKEILIHRDTQEADLVTSGIVVATLPISSGAPGYTTPAGKYTIYNHFEKAYSEEYKLWMPYWMAIQREGMPLEGYGLHSLPYWNVSAANYEEGQVYNGRLYTENKLYEGFDHLGTPVSHGCVRFGIREAEIIYNWAENGTSVVVL